MDVRSKLRTFIASEILGSTGEFPLSDSDDLLQNGLDSLGILRLTVFIEDKIGVTIPDETVTPDNIRSVDALVRLIESHQ